MAKTYDEMNFEFNALISIAQSEIKAGRAIRYTTTNGIIDVETDQGWSQWYPLGNGE